MEVRSRCHVSHTSFPITYAVAINDKKALIATVRPIHAFVGAVCTRAFDRPLHRLEHGNVNAVIDFNFAAVRTSTPRTQVSPPRAMLLASFPLRPRIAPRSSSTRTLPHRKLPLTHPVSCSPQGVQ